MSVIDEINKGFNNKSTDFVLIENLSEMENGKRPIDKVIAKRNQKQFGLNYRYFLG